MGRVSKGNDHTDEYTSQMVSDSVIQLSYFLGHVASGLLTAALGYWVVGRTEMRGRRRFGLFAVTATLWSWVSAASVAAGQPNTLELLAVLYSWTSLLSGITLLGFAGGFTDRTFSDSRVLQVAAVGGLVCTVIVLTEPVHNSYWASLTIHQTPFPHAESTAGLLNLVVILYTFGCLSVTCYYLFERYLRSQHRPSSAMLVIVVGILVAITPFALSRQGLVFIETYDHTGYGVAVFAVAFAYAAFRLDLVDVAPVARNKTVETLPDPYLAVDDDGELVDYNQAAQQIFDISQTQLGSPLRTVSAKLGSAVAQEERLTPDASTPWPDGEQPATGSEQLTLQVGETNRQFDLNVSPIRGPRNEPRGQQIVLRDITALKEREQEIRAREQDLRMVKQVFSRVFRHNVRNELSVTRAQLEAVREQSTDSEITESAQRAIESTDRLLNHSKNAREIERVIEKETVATEQPIGRLVADAVGGWESDGVTIRTDVDDVSVLAVTGFETAIESAVENAIQHNPAPVTIDIETTVDEETATLRVCDDGSGIPANEIAILDEEETALSHGSGVGLWLMKWYTNRSGGQFDIGQTETGTRVQMTLDRPSSVE